VINADKGERSNTNEDSEIIGLNFISDLLLKEVQIPTLQYLSPDTFQMIARFIRNLSLQKYEDIELKIRDELIRLTSLATRLLIEVRCLKLISEIDEGLDLPAILASEQYSKLTEEEKYVLEANLDAFKKKESLVLASTEGREKMLKIFSKLVHSRKVIVRFLKPIEQFIGVDMNKYGPFLKEDVAVLPFENARSLIEDGTAEEIRNDMPSM
jgi:DNA replication factor GINS